MIGIYRIGSFDQNAMIYVSSNKNYSSDEIIPFSTNKLVLLWSQSYFPNISKFYQSMDAWNSVQFNQSRAVKLLEKYILKNKDKKILIVDFDCVFANKKIKNGSKILDLNKKHLIKIYPYPCPVHYLVTYP